MKLLFLLLVIFTRHSRALDTREIGKIFDFPPEHLLVQNRTEEEQMLYSIPTSAEQYEKKSPPLDASDVLASFRVVGKIPFTFYPVTITICRHGSLLRPPFLHEIERISSLSNDFSSHLGFTDSAKTGGLLWHEIRTPSPPNTSPITRIQMGIVYEARHTSQMVDVQVTWRSSFDTPSQPLRKLPNGEGLTYFNFFRSLPAGPDEQEPPPMFPWKTSCPKIGQIAVDWYTKEGSGLSKIMPAQLTRAITNSPFAISSAVVAAILGIFLFVRSRRKK